MSNNDKQDRRPQDSLFPDNQTTKIPDSSPERGSLHQQPRIGMLYMLGAALGFSVMSAFVKAGAETLPVAQVIVFRSGINAIAISILMLYSRVPLCGNNVPLLLFRAFLGTVAIGLAFYATSVIPLIDASVIVKTSVLFTALFASRWLKERNDAAFYGLIILGFLGVVLILKPSGEVIEIGGIAALVSAVLIGLVGAVIRKLQETEHSLTIINYYTWTATLFYAALFGSVFQYPTSTELLYLIGSGLSGTLAQWSFTLAYKYAPASQVSPFLFSEVLFAALFGAVYFHEIPDFLSILGASFIIFSGIVIARRTKKRQGT